MWRSGRFRCAVRVAAKISRTGTASGTDGVGTKLRPAMDLKRHDAISGRSVAMCANDLVVQARNRRFLDNMPRVTGCRYAASVIKSIAEGCLQSGCALVGGETAEMGVRITAKIAVAGFCASCSRKIRNHRRPSPLKHAGLRSAPARPTFSLIKSPRKIIDVSGRDPQNHSAKRSRWLDHLLKPTTAVKSVLN